MSKPRPDINKDGTPRKKPGRTRKPKPGANWKPRPGWIDPNAKIIPKPKVKTKVKAKIKTKVKVDPEVVRKTFEDLSNLNRHIMSEDFDGMPRAELEALLTTATELENRQLYNSIDGYFPDTGPFRRELYKPHTEFFRQGATKRIRAMIAANRIGKTVSGAYEMALHLTGEYPAWWEGKRFRDPILAWTAGDTNITTRNIQQKKMLGPPGQFGSGMIRKELVYKSNAKSGIPDAVESVLVKHVSGGLSNLMFKSYEQKRIAFQGDDVDVIWLDEECSMAIYGECLIRTMTTGGLVMITFTPLLGLSEVVEGFMPDGIIPETQTGAKFIINATWEDAPHLTEKDKKEILDDTPIYLRDARAKGIPQLGVGLIYPILEEDITVDDFELPMWWPRAFALDVGWKATAALWGAWDRESDIVYIYSAYKQGQAEPATHVQAINARGSWIPGCADPAARASSQKDGKNLFNEYCDLGLDLSLADNSVEAGIFAVWQRLVSGRLKIFKSLQPFFAEFRLYHRDENGKVVKKNDHIMDCLHPDTRVITDKGQVKIKDLVGTTGKVLSVDGKFEKYRNCKIYGENRDVIKLTFSDKSEITCTPDHQFLTPDGWKIALDMKNSDCYNKITKTIRGKDLWKSRSYQKNSKISWVQHTGYVENTFKGTDRDYIVMYGDTIMGKFREGCVSTILTVINQITKLKIWLLSQKEGIQANIRKVIQEVLHKKLLIWPQSGIPLMMALDGINNTTTTSSTFSMRKKNIFANNVENRIYRRRIDAIDSVLITASRHGDACKVLITSQKNAQSAGETLFRTNTTKHLHVQGSVGVKCVAIQDAGQSDVYCLDVPTTHAFAVENGQIVHNCLRYIILTGMGNAVEMPFEELYGPPFTHHGMPRVMGNVAVDSHTGY